MSTRKPLTAPALYALSWDKEVARLKKLGRAIPGRIEIPTDVSGGLRIVLFASGRKSFGMRFRKPDGKAGNLTLGRLDLDAKGVGEPVIGSALTLAGARRLASKITHELAHGLDPVAARAASKAAAKALNDRTTFGSASLDFMIRHAMHTRYAGDIGNLIGYRVASGEPVVVLGGIADRWKNKPLDEVTRQDVKALINECRIDGVPGRTRVRGEGPSPSRERSAFAILSTTFAWFAEQDLIERSPMDGMKRPKAPAARERVLNDTEIRWFWSACEALPPVFGRLLQLLLLSGARRDEVAGMTREELVEEPEGVVWVIPGVRSKNGREHRLPLTKAARELLEDVPPNGGSLIFSNTTYSPVSGFSKIKIALDAAMLRLAVKEKGKTASIKPWRIHDLRRTCATGMAELGVPPHIVEAVLNHISGAKAGVAGVYNRATYPKEKRAAAERWSAHVLSLVGRAKGENVVMFPAKGG